VERSINYYLIDCQAAFSFSLPMPGRRTGNLNPIPKPLYTAIQRDLFASFAIVASSSSLHCAAQQGSSAAAANNNNSSITVRRGYRSLLYLVGPYLPLAKKNAKYNRKN